MLVSADHMLSNDTSKETNDIYTNAIDIAGLSDIHAREQITNDHASSQARKRKGPDDLKLIFIEGYAADDSGVAFIENPPYSQDNKSGYQTLKSDEPPSKRIHTKQSIAETSLEIATAFDSTSASKTSSAPVELAAVNSVASPSMDVGVPRRKRVTKKEGALSDVSKMTSGDLVIDTEGNFEPCIFRKITPLFSTPTPADFIWSWTTREGASARRLVRFSADVAPTTGNILIHGQSIPPEEFDWYAESYPDAASVVVSCIFCEGIGSTVGTEHVTYWITHHDITRLAEAVLDIRHRKCHTADYRAR